MINNKVHTAQSFGKYVRNISFALFLILCTISCIDEAQTTDVIDNITGTWTIKENSTEFGEQNYEVTISKASDNSIYIKNFYQMGFTYKIEVDIDGLDLNIFSQRVDENDFSGTGNVYSNYKQIDLDYIVDDDGSGGHNFTAVLKPKF